MFGNTSQVSPLEARKECLIAASELNRSELSAEWQTMAQGVRDLAHGAKTIGAWASAAALLVAGVTAWRSVPPAPRAAKRSWFQTMLNGVRLASTIWLAFRSSAHRKEAR